MHRRRQIAVLSFAALMAALAVGAAWPGMAQAQTRPGNDPQLRPGAGGFSTTVRPAAGNGDASDRPSTVPEAANPEEVPTDPAADPEDAQPRLRLGRRAIVDGDMSWPPEPQAPRDGIAAPEETEVIDGSDPTIDTRDPEDIAAFERPAAGFDPDAFAVEIEPILDRRPARLARFEPFQPAGVKVGRFVVFPEAEITFAGYDNLYRSSGNVRRDIALDVRPTVRVVSNWRAHALEFRATGLNTFHNQFPKEDDRFLTLEARGRIDITRHTNVELLTSYDRAQDVRGSINAPSLAGDRSEYETTRAALTFNHRFNRLSLQLRGTVTETDYAPVDTGGGIIASNLARDVSQREAAARATWAFKPTLAVFAEVAGNVREYKAPPADGVRRDSTGDRTRIGVSFGNTSQILRGEVSVGYANQRYDDSRMQTVSGIILDTNLAWRLTGLTSVLLTARADVTDALLPGTGGALSQTAGVELRHAFQRNLIGTTGVTLTRQDYEGISLSERSITGLASLEYFLNREVTLFGRYQHVDFESTNLARNYNWDEVRVGVRIRR